MISQPRNPAENPLGTFFDMFCAALYRSTPDTLQLVFFLVLDTTRRFTGSFSDGMPM
jgi:hypothetical protein